MMARDYFKTTRNYFIYCEEEGIRKYVGTAKATSAVDAREEFLRKHPKFPRRGFLIAVADK